MKLIIDGKVKPRKVLRANRKASICPFVRGTIWASSAYRFIPFRYLSLTPRHSRVAVSRAAWLFVSMPRYAIGNYRNSQTYTENMYRSFGSTFTHRALYPFSRGLEVWGEGGGGLKIIHGQRCIRIFISSTVNTPVVDGCAAQHRQIILQLTAALPNISCEFSADYVEIHNNRTE